ncbi:hypothetical protein [uncultured Roseobacter sp.]|uniref:hypothetical protein n=1 Tax=uncultured Roseobacter sp. TaxID=114847 RepID=UPI00261D41C6|nr:hypothetical protein [uncultured Roseobacter sp.]
MKLKAEEEKIIHDYVMGTTATLPEDHDDILTKMEVGIEIRHSIEFEYEDVRLGIREGTTPAFSLTPRDTGLIIFTHDAKLTRQVLNAFKEGIFKTLTLRVERSWACYVRCDNEVLYNECEEDRNSVVACCQDLKEQC